jgi:tight adherence protein B
VNVQDLINTILLGSLFVLVFSAWTICVLLWMVQYARRRKQVQKRIGLGDRGIDRSQMLQLWRDERQARTDLVEVKREKLGERLERLREEAGWKLPALVMIFFAICVAGLVAVITTMLGYGLWLGAALGLVVLMAFRSLTQKRIMARLGLFERQFVDSLRIAARALRAGHPLVGAFQSISEEIGEPMGSIFGEICQEQALGLDLQESPRPRPDRVHAIEQADPHRHSHPVVPGFECHLAGVYGGVLQHLGGQGHVGGNRGECAVWRLVDGKIVHIAILGVARSYV